MNNNVFFSIVIPVYGCKTLLIELYIRLRDVLEPISENFEIIMVNDNSPDDAWTTIIELAQKDSRVKGLNLSRNFGQHYAITAGLSHCTGEWVVVMDCDLQDRPEEITKLYEKTLEGYDVVLGRRIQRKDPFLKRFLSKMFYNVLSYLTETKLDSTIANFGIYHSKVIKAILSMKDSLRYFPTMVKWVGFKQISINIEHAERISGKTSYNFKKLFNLSLDVMLAFSDKPLRLTIKIGILISFLSILFGVIQIIAYFQGNILYPGWASLIVSISFLFGVLIFFIGILGLYIGKVFEKVKERPIYIVKETCNFK